jgi:uncharacterized protein YecT (DUF1311 family)
LLPSTRARLLPLERAWIRKKDADCAVESAAASIESMAKETARLICDTRITKDRIGWLANYRDDGASFNPTSSSSEDAPDGQD